MNTVKLGEYGSFRNGLNFSKEESKGKGCKILGVGDFENKTFIPVDSLDEINTDLVTEDDIIQNGDIIFVRSNGNKSLVGRMLLAKGIEERICYSGFCIRFRPYNSNNSLNLFYALKSPYCKKQYTPSQQTNITNLSQDKLSEVLIPDFLITSSQNKAVNLLSNLDEMIDLNKRLCTELEAMAKTLYDYWFVQFDFPDENGKPYRTSGGAMEWCQELGREVPKGWKAGAVADLGEIVSGATPSTTEENYYTSNGIAWITPNDLSDNEHNMFIFHGERDITEAGLNSCSVVLMPAGSVLMSSRAPIGYLAIAANSVCTNQGFKSIICNKDYGTLFVYYTLKRNIQGIARQGVGTTFKEVSRDTLARYTILLPDTTIAKRFEQMVAPISQTSKKCEQENRELIALRDWLLPMLMNGQIKINEKGE